MLLGSVLRVEVTSKLSVTPAEALTDATEQFEKCLLAELVKRESRLSETQLIRSLPSLWRYPNARFTESTEEIEKPYGKMYRRSMKFEASEELVRDWLDHKVKIMVGTVLLTFAGWAGLVFAAIRIDRQYRGYRRAAVFSIAFLVGTLATTSGWTLFANR